jgi:hypothetical protein
MVGIVSSIDFRVPLPMFPTVPGKRKWEAHQKPRSENHQET